MTTRNPSNTPTQTKWTWFELVGLILAFGLIGWPVLNFAVGAVFPPNAQGEAVSPFSLTTTASVSNAAPGEQFNYIFAIKANRSATLGRLTNVLPDQLNYVNSFCVPPNCDRVNNSEYNVDKHTLSFTGTSTAFQAGDSVTLVLVVQLSKNATGTVKNTAQICDTSQNCVNSATVTVTVGGSGSTTTAAATATAVPPTVTAVPPTATAVPPTATAVPPTATATAVPPTATPAAPPTATPIAAPTPTPAKATTPPNAIGNGQAGTPSSDQATVSAATATAEPTTAAATTRVANTPAPTTGVIGGSFTASAGPSALSGNRVDLVLRGGGTEKVVASSTIDGTGNYSFLDVPPTGSGQVYYVRYTNTTGSKTLRNWSTISFTFSGGQAKAPAADLSDVMVGLPGSAGTSFTLPLTLNWNKRVAGDVYSITVFRADGTGVAYASGDLGSAASYTIKNGALPAGGYIAEINVTNANGSGVSQGQFIFKAGTAAAATTSAAVAAPATTAAAAPTATAAPTPTRVPVPPGDKGEVLPDSSGPTATIAPTVAATVPATDTSTGATPSAVTDTPDLAPIAQVISVGVISFVNGLDQGTPAALPPATNSLPQSGGELPLAGLLLAAGVLGWRRYRLVAQPKA